MDTNSGSNLAAINQAPLADEIVAVLAAVVSDATAPDSALGALRKTRNDTVPPEQRAAAAALQAYGVECAATVMTAGLETDAQERAASLGKSLEQEASDQALSVLRSDPDAASEFKARLSLAIATKCADLIAAEIDREKRGHFNILNEDDAAVFEARREMHRKQRTEAARDFLASLPERYPSSGTDLFAHIRHAVQQHIEQEHKRPDTHRAVAALFDDALASMPEATRAAIGRATHTGH